MWSKGRASAPSGKGPKFGSKCDHRRKKVWHFFFLLSSGFFCSFFFTDSFVSCLTITSLSGVSLSLALLAPNLEHALTMSPLPLPCLHMYSPMTTYDVLSPQVDVLPSLRLVLQDAPSSRDTAPCQDQPGDRLARSPFLPPTLPNYTFVCFNLFVFVSVCVLQLGQNNPLWGCLNATGKTIVINRPPPPQNLVFPFLCCLSCLVCLSCVLILPLPFVLCSFLNKFSSFVVFFSQKRSPKNTATLFGLVPATPLQHQRFPHHVSCVSPATRLSMFALISPFPVVCKARIFGPIFWRQKSAGLLHPHQGPFHSPNVPPSTLCHPPLVRQRPKTF